jgi:hypothetical protein
MFFCLSHSFISISIFFAVFCMVRYNKSLAPAFVLAVWGLYFSYCFDDWKSDKMTALLIHLNFRAFSKAAWLTRYSLADSLLLVLQVQKESWSAASCSYLGGRKIFEGFGTALLDWVEVAYFGELFLLTDTDIGIGEMIFVSCSSI